jgi:ribosomal protein S17E
VNFTRFLVMVKVSEKGATSVTDRVGIVGEILSAALDNLGTSDSVRALSQVLGEHYGTCSAMLWGLKSDGNLQLVESFGFSEAIQEEYGFLSLFEPYPITDSIREGKIVRLSASELLEKYPKLFDEPPGYPVTDSIREEKIVRLSASELSEKYPETSEVPPAYEVTYMVPCTSSGSPLGGLVVCFFTTSGEKKVPELVLEALRVAAFHVLSRQTGLVEVF